MAEEQIIRPTDGLPNEDDVVMSTEADRGVTASSQGQAGAEAEGSTRNSEQLEDGESAEAQEQTDVATTTTATAKKTSSKQKKGANAAASTSSATANVQPTFPLARVSRIVKADRDVEATSKDAIWTIAVATELFIKHLTDSAVASARLDKKKMVTYKELANAVEGQGEFFFLQDVVPQPVPLNKAFERRRALDEENRARAVGLLIDEDSEAEEEEADPAAVVEERDGKEPAAAGEAEDAVVPTASKSKKAKAKKSNGKAAPEASTAPADVLMDLDGHSASEIPS